MSILVSLTGSFVNVVLVLLGGGIGLLVKKGLPERVSDTVMKAMALCVLFIGIDGALEGSNALIAVISMAVGTIIGSLLDLDKHINNVAQKIESKLSKGNDKPQFAEGFVTASLLFCVGAMAIVGSLESGISHDYSTLITKSVIDAVSSIVFASTLGWGVLASVVPVFIYQGTITLLAGFVAPYLNDYTVAHMTCVGSLLIIAIALNMMKLTNIKVMNCLPSVFLPIIICMFLK
ncbi:MAG: DUF554 domain-containing protein [Clostridia bacterium]|nr:DUF554 domain-containing protein [Clostridia bacterium]MBR6619235.1 DUF554 domain-containing protein [Clostridia bacterium]